MDFPAPWASVMYRVYVEGFECSSACPLGQDLKNVVQREQRWRRVWQREV